MRKLDLHKPVMLFTFAVMPGKSKKTWVARVPVIVDHIEATPNFVIVGERQDGPRLWLTIAAEPAMRANDARRLAELCPYAAGARSKSVLGGVRAGPRCRMGSPFGGGHRAIFSGHRLATRRRAVVRQAGSIPVEPIAVVVLLDTGQYLRVDGRE